MLTGWGSPDNFVKTLTIKWLAVYDGEVDDPTSQLRFIMVDKVILFLPNGENNMMKRMAKCS